MISILIMIIFLLGISSFLDGHFKTMKRTKKNAILLTKEKKSLEDRIEEQFIYPLATRIEPLIKLDSDHSMKFEGKLKSVGLYMTPEMYYSKAISVGIYMLCMPLLCVVMGAKGVVAPAIILVFLTVYSSATRHKRLAEKKRQEIEKALPTFIRTILYKLNDKQSNIVKADLIAIFEDYIKVANSVFLYDVSLLIMEMKSKEIETALRNFSFRLQIPEVAFLSNTLIGIVRGEHHEETLNALAREMDARSRDYIQKELDKRPRKVIRACIPLFILTLFTIVYVLITAITHSMNQLT